jgi:hypothetical protein
MLVGAVLYYLRHPHCYCGYQLPSLGYCVSEDPHRYQVTPVVDCTLPLISSFLLPQTLLVAYLQINSNILIILNISAFFARSTLNENKINKELCLPPALTLVSCLAYFFDPEDGGDMFVLTRLLTFNGLHGVYTRT